MSRFDAVIFDMDGTLVDSRLDFQAVRRELGLAPEKGLLEAIQALPAERRAPSMSLLIQREMEAARQAGLIDGACEAVEAVRRALGKAGKVVVVDRNFSFGASGIFAQEVRAALCNAPGHPPVFGYIAGLGGRDITAQLLSDIYFEVKRSERPERESVWAGLQEVNRAT